MKRQNILKRKRINMELNYIMRFPLTIVVAAMGYGKTTAAWEYLGEMNIKNSWLSVEDDESSPQYIWDSLTRQLSKTVPKLGEQLHRLGFPTDRAQRDKVIQIIEENTYRTETVIVIDDYHFAHSKELDSLIERLVRNNIEGLHILILSRTIPGFRVDDLILKGYCYRVKSNLFEVSESEIEAYFKLFGHDISNELASEIYKMSEGWVTAIHLIVKRYLEIGKLESVRSIDRLIETTVISRYTKEELDLLKTLSVLDYFTAEQAVHVTKNNLVDKIIQRLSYENSFIRYNKQDEVYRIHNIFNNFLINLVKENPDELDLNYIYKRSGTWCTSNGKILLGLKYLLKAKEYDLFLEEFEKERITEVVDSNSKFIEQLFEEIPMNVKFRHPTGYLFYIGFYVTNIDGVKGQKLVSEVQSYYEKHNEVLEISKDQIMGEIELIKSYIDFNDVEKMHLRMKTAHKLLEGKSVIANKDKIITFGSPHIVYLYYKKCGEMLSAVETLEQLFPYYNEMADGCGVGFEYQIRAEYNLEKGNLKEAEIYAYKAIYKARTLEQISVIICSNLTLARIFMARGDITKAQNTIDEFSDDVESCNSPILSSAFDLSMGYLGAITGDSKVFSKWLKSGDMESSGVLYQGMGFNYIIYGKYLMIEQDYIKLELLCEDMIRIFKPFENVLGYLHGYLLDAIAKYNLYGWEKAEKSLLAALEIGKADGIKLPFSEYGVHIVELLEKIKLELKNDTYVDELIKEVKIYAINLKKETSLTNSELKLTKRENEVLQNIVNGKTNKEISTELFIAEVTVRKNITRIYRKLNVDGRVEAVKKVIELKIL